jgi:hypothetical protein
MIQFRTLAHLLLFIFAVLGIKPRALHVLGKRSTSGYTSSPFFAHLKGFLHTPWMKEGKTVGLW